MKIKHLVILPIILTCILLPNLAFANDAMTIAKEISEKIEAQFYNRDFLSINKQEHSLRTTQSRLPDGRWELTFIYSRLGDVSQRWANDEWLLMFKLVDEWIQLTPNHPAPYLAKAKILISYAWDARGGGLAHTVAPVEWKLFKQRISQAREVLESSGQITKNNPYWFLQMLIIAKAQNWEEKSFNRLYADAVKAFPTYYYIHFRAADYYQPRWHGSKKKLRNFVDNAVKNSKSLEGMTLYTRIYWSQLWALQDSTFGPGYAEWESMRQGFEDIQHQYPDSFWNLNAYAYYACMAKDWTTANQLINQIGNQPHLSVWQSKSRFYSCKELSKQEKIKDTHPSHQTYKEI